jgi:hypothetical protein
MLFFLTRRAWLRTFGCSGLVPGVSIRVSFQVCGFPLPILETASDGPQAKFIQAHLIQLVCPVERWEFRLIVLRIGLARRLQVSHTRTRTRMPYLKSGQVSLDESLDLAPSQVTVLVLVSVPVLLPVPVQVQEVLVVVLVIKLGNFYKSRVRLYVGTRFLVSFSWGTTIATSHLSQMFRKVFKIVSRQSRYKSKTAWMRDSHDNFKTYKPTQEYERSTRDTRSSLEATTDKTTTKLYFRQNGISGISLSGAHSQYNLSH